MIYAYDAETNKTVRAGNLQFVNALMKAKRKKQPWEVVDLIVESFRKIKPERYKSYLIRMESVRAAQKKTWVGNKEFRGVSRDKVNDALLAHTVDFPVWIMLLLRKVYDTKELIMDKEFYREFGERYPEYKVMEVI